MRIVPMNAGRIGPMIERTYGESSTYQWVRETYRNAVEAKATRILYGIEWQGVENSGVYRRYVADNGIGMSPDDLRMFFRTYGGGGKPIGGEHENYGVGSKTSLLPWNKFGLVVVSYVDGDASMIWLTYDEESGDYGLREWRDIEDEYGNLAVATVVEPYYDEDLGIDFRTVAPEWCRDHGTVLLMLGETPDHDTALGDESKGETAIKGIVEFLNSRIWDIPEGVSVTVETFRHTERKRWPASRDQGGPERIWPLGVYGARHYVTELMRGEEAVLQTDSRELTDGTRLTWYLWSEARAGSGGYAPDQGFFATLYEHQDGTGGELFDISTHHSTFRQFGITHGDVRKRLYLVAQPPLSGRDDDPYGVYMNTPRTSLLVRGSARAGEPLPIRDWAEEFASRMPDEIATALREARGAGEPTYLDDTWRERLGERFGRLWRLDRIYSSRGGAEGFSATTGRSPKAKTSGPRAKSTSTSPPVGPPDGEPRVGVEDGETPGIRRKVPGGVPEGRHVPAHAFPDDEKYLAVWNPPTSEHPAGLVQVNSDHPVLRKVIEFHSEQYAPHLADEIEEKVLQVYVEVAVAKVAHSQFLRRMMSEGEVEELRSPGALTASLLGLISEEAVIGQRLGTLGPKQRSA